jgi:hypothetical protein
VNLGELVDQGVTIDRGSFDDVGDRFSLSSTPLFLRNPS